MSACGYYSCFKGKPTCSHPTYGVQYTQGYKRELHIRCNRCRIECNGIYPSNIPKANQEGWIQEIVDSKGNVLG